MKDKTVVETRVQIRSKLFLLFDKRQRNYAYHFTILGLFCIVPDSDLESNETSHDTSSHQSLEELDPLANHHVAYTENALLNPNYRFDPNYRTEFSVDPNYRTDHMANILEDPMANVPAMSSRTNI